MTDNNSHQQFADRLLEQETRVSEAQLSENRLKLQQKLAQADRRERRMRVVTICMAIVVLLGPCVLMLEHFVNPVPGERSAFPHITRVLSLLPDTVATVIGISLGVCYLTCVVCVIPFLLLYFLQYRRKLQQTQREQILVILEDLQREVAALRERTPHRDDQP
jgi:Flp pilus assembly protein TadB